MTYRNDHEAALLRVDALEQEVARLRTAAPPPKPATKPRVGASLLRIGIAMLVTGVGVAAVVGRDRPAAVAAPAIVEVAQPVEVELDSVKDCIAKIAPLDRALDETTTDPNGAAVSTANLAKTGASCRVEIAALANSAASPELRDKFRRWSIAEDKLADPISLITVYYANNPYALDHYSTAPQLWREYHRARNARDAVLAEFSAAR